VVGHAAGVGALGRHQLEHGQQEVADAARLLDAKVVLLTQDVGKGPVAQAVDVAELAFAVEDFLRPFAADAQRFGERAQQLDDLCYMIVVFAVLCARLRVEEVVACDKFESLKMVLVSFFIDILPTRKRFQSQLTIAAILQTSVLAPHFAPRITSGERYCLVWMSFVKWCPTQHALPKSAILTEIISMPSGSSFSNSSVGCTCAVLPKSIPETLLARMSLEKKLALENQGFTITPFIDTLTQSSRVPD